MDENTPIKNENENSNGQNGQSFAFEGEAAQDKPISTESHAEDENGTSEDLSLSDDIATPRTNAFDALGTTDGAVDKGTEEKSVPRETSIYYAPCKKRSLRSGNQFLILTLVCLLLLVTVCSLIGSYFITNFLIANNTEDDRAVVVFHPSKDEPVLAGSAAEVYQSVAKTVVVVNGTGTVKSQSGQTVSISGAGSGVIISSADDQSYIITNHHVIDGYENIKVGLSDGRTFGATVVGADWMTDIAILRIGVGNLSTACIGASDTLHPGQTVVAIGNPLGTLGGSITDGLVSGPIQREVLINGISMSLIQSSTPVSPGNSGGGLFNMYGELVGIVNAKYTSVGAECISFAIPSATVASVTGELIEKHYVAGRPTLPLTYEKIYVSTLENNTAYLIYVDKNLAYDEARGTQQLLPGDRIVKINDKNIDEIADIRGALVGMPVDGSQSVKVQIVRTTEQQSGPFTYTKETVYTFDVPCVEYKGEDHVSEDDDLLFVD